MQMMGGGNITTAEANTLNRIDPINLGALNQGSGVVPALAAGAAAGNGEYSGFSSSITPNRAINRGEFLYVCEFVPRPAATSVESTTTVGNIVIRAAGRVSPDPTNLNDYMLGAHRLRQWAIDMHRWPNDIGYLTGYIGLIIELDKTYTWPAINKFDRTFRQSLASPTDTVTKTWEHWPQRLFAECFEIDATARKRSSFRDGASANPGSRSTSSAGGKSASAGKGTKRSANGSATASSGNGKMNCRDWATAHLTHHTVNGNSLCFLNQREGKCHRGANCQMEHGFCGMCKAAGHVAKDCPSGPPPP
jgi:hypothetical protein